MPSVCITSALKDQIYFVTFTVKHWLQFFDRHDRFRILENSFVHCQKAKQLKIYAFVFMVNHLHFIASSPDLGSTIRDIKRHLSKIFHANILATEPQILKIFEKEGIYEFWEKTNYPKLIETQQFLQQKIDYIHFNPVKKQYIHEPEDWRWSSASKIPCNITLSQLET